MTEHDLDRAGAIWAALLMALAMGGAAICATASLVSERTAMQSTLVRGERCEGETGTLYAREEDELPHCERILRVTLSSIAKGE